MSRPALDRRGAPYSGRDGDITMNAMNDSPASVNGKMILLAREARGLSQLELARALRISQARMSKVEMDLAPVTLDLLDQLTQALKYPAHFFRQDAAIMGVSIPEVFHRKRQDVPKKLLNKVYAQIEIRRLHIKALMQAVELESENTIEPLDVEQYGGRVDEIARLVRSAWNLPRGPVDNMTEVLEDAGAIVCAFDFETQRIDAISRWVPGLPPLVFVNDKIPTDRLRFTIAHELGHLIMHSKPNPDIEEQANRFAAEFLMPARDIATDLAGLKLTKLAALKQYWKVSMAGLIYRAEELRAITENQARYLRMQMTNAGYRTREPMEFDIKPEQPMLLQEIVERHQEELGYSEEDLAQMLALEPEEVIMIYLRPEPQLPPKVVILSNYHHREIPVEPAR